MKLPFTKITAESAIASLTKAVEDLQVAASYHQAKADRLGEKAARLVTQENEHIQAAQKAERIRSKLSELLA